MSLIGKVRQRFFSFYFSSFFLFSLRHFFVFVNLCHLPTSRSSAPTNINRLYMTPPIRGVADLAQSDKQSTSIPFRLVVNLLPSIYTSRKLYPSPSYPHRARPKYSTHEGRLSLNRRGPKLSIINGRFGRTVCDGDENSKVSLDWSVMR